MNTYSFVGVVIIELWSLFRQFGHPNKFRLIHRLYEGARTGNELASDTGLSSSTVRSNMRSLKSSGFVTNVREDGERRYRLDLPLPSFVHEILLVLVLMADTPPAKKAKDAGEPPLEADRQRLINYLENRKLTHRIKTVFSQLFQPRSPGQRIQDIRELEEKLESIQSSTDRIRDNTDENPD